MNEPTSLKPFFTTCVAILVPLAAAVAIFSQWPGYGLADLAQGHRLPAEEQTKPAPKSMADALDEEFQALVERVMPCVVSVHTSKENAYKKVLVGKSSTIELQGLEVVITPGVGSGVVISKEGLILTCWHVIKDLDFEDERDVCVVTLHKEEEPREVDVVGVDRNMDLAVLKLRKPPERDLAVLTFGDSDVMHSGNIVMAVGSPFGLRDTVSQGILSNCDRRLGVSPEAQSFFQTDCEINPGNSGGPLVNLKGELIGINWALYSGQPDVHAWQGIGLVVRAKEAKASLDAMLDRSSPRPYVGMGLEETKFDPLQDTKRVFIDSVSKDSPADQAGLRPNDVLLAINGSPVANKEEASKRIQRRRVGEVMELTVTREGQSEPLKLQVTVADMDKNAPPPPAVLDLSVELGLKVRDAAGRDPFIYKKSRQWSQGGEFVIIEEVGADSALAGKVKPGDILFSLGTPSHLKSTSELKALLTARKATEPLKLTIWRDAQTKLELDLP